AVVHQPDLLVLDEPFSGLDPVNQERLEALILAERDRGATVLFSTHVMAHAERLCDRLAIIAGGKRRFEGTVAEARGLLPMRAHYV
ncbi:ABC transporter ATP-binding protein, partial [Pseudomonas sp. GW531-E2]